MADVRTAAEVLTGRELGVAYRSMSRDVAREAVHTQVAGRTLEAGIQRQWARIAQRAALAEELHPDSPEPPACSVCGRTQSCLAVQ